MVFVAVCALLSCASEDTIIPDREITSATSPYLVCDTTMTCKNNALKCHLRIYKVTPQALSKNDTLKVAEHIINVAHIGNLKDQTLYVSSKEITSNEHTTSEVTENSKNAGDFYWTEKTQLHTLQPYWGDLSHKDKISVKSTEVDYAKGEKSFHYNFNTELKKVYDEIVYEEDVASTTPNYLGTRILCVEGWCSGIKFASSTGKVTLIQSN